MKMVEEYLAKAAACRKAAKTEPLENVRQVHLRAATSWEVLADRAMLIISSNERSVFSQFEGSSVPPPAECDDYDCNHPAEAMPARAPRDDAPRPAEELARHPAKPHADGNGSPTPGVGITLYADDGNLRTLEEIEADVIRLAIGRYQGHMAEVARRLGIGRSTLYRKIGEMGIDNAAR